MKNFLLNGFHLFYTILFRRNKFKLRISQKNHEFVIWDRPGKWCDKEEIDKISSDLFTIAQLAQEGKGLPEYGVFSSEKSNFSDRNITIIYDRVKKDPVAFSAQLYLKSSANSKKVEVMHTGLSYIIPDQRGKGLLRLLFIYPMVILLIKSGLRPIWVSSLSQVPSVIGVVAESFDKVFPDPWMKNEQSYEQNEIAFQIVNSSKDELAIGGDIVYNRNMQIIENSYSLASTTNLKKDYEETKKHRDVLVNEFCKEHLNYSRGDDFLQIGQWTVDGLFRFLKKNVSNTFIVQHLFTAFVVVMKFTIVPIIRLIIPKT